MNINEANRTLYWVSGDFVKDTGDYVAIRQEPLDDNSFEAFELAETIANFFGYSELVRVEEETTMTINQSEIFSFYLMSDGNILGYMEGEYFIPRNIPKSKEDIIRIIYPFAEDDFIEEILMNEDENRELHNALEKLGLS